jgi:hypothetical protein
MESISNSIVPFTNEEGEDSSLENEVYNGRQSYNYGLEDPLQSSFKDNSFNKFDRRAHVREDNTILTLKKGLRKR